MRDLRQCLLFCMVTMILLGCSSRIDDSDAPEVIQEVAVIQSKFTNDQNGNILVLSICKSDDGPADELNMDALSAVIDFNTVVMQDLFRVSGYPCGIFSGEGSSYACWTSSPRASGVLEYDPNVVSEEEVIKIIQSIYQKPEL